MAVRGFPGDPVVKTWPSKAQGAGSNTGRGTRISYASWPNKSKHKTERNIVTNSIKTLKEVHIKTKKKL